MPDEQDIISRMTRIEVTQEHTDKHITELNNTTKKLVSVVQQLVNQREALKRLHENQEKMNVKVEENSRKIFENQQRSLATQDKVNTIEKQLKEYRKMEEDVNKNSMTTKGIIFVISTLFVGTISIVTALIKGLFGG